MNLGKIVGISKTQHIILRALDWKALKRHPSIGDTVFTSEKQKIGFIYDIFGPVSQPYLSVKLFNNTSEKLGDFNDKKGDFLYSYHQSSKKRKSKKRKTYTRKRGGINRISPS